jgi:DNA invertase Pin-like site-specific DNA recombinase
VRPETGAAMIFCAHCGLVLAQRVCEHFNIDPDSPVRPVFGIFAALAEFKRELIRGRTIAGLSSAHCAWSLRRPSLLDDDRQAPPAQAAMAKRDTKLSNRCKELGVTRQTLYRFVGPKGELQADATKLLKRKAQNVSS